MPTSPVRALVGSWARDRRHQRVPSDNAVEMWLGISTDEAIPIKTSRNRWIETKRRWPECSPRRSLKTRYHADGLNSTLAYYNNPDSVDAQWYVFIATPDGEILGHYNAEDLGVHLEEMLDDGSFRANEEGIWVTHEDVNPVTGEIEDKHFWLAAHDGLVFGSGWHHDESGN